MDCILLTETALFLGLKQIFLIYSVMKVTFYVAPDFCS